MGFLIVVGGTLILGVLFLWGVSYPIKIIDKAADNDKRGSK